MGGDCSWTQRFKFLPLSRFTQTLLLPQTSRRQEQYQCTHAPWGCVNRRPGATPPPSPFIHNWVSVTKVQNVSRRAFRLLRKRTISTKFFGGGRELSEANFEVFFLSCCTHRISTLLSKRAISRAFLGVGINSQRDKFINVEEACWQPPTPQNTPWWTEKCDPRADALAVDACKMAQKAMIQLISPPFKSFSRGKRKWNALYNGAWVMNFSPPFPLLFQQLPKNT